MRQLQKVLWTKGVMLSPQHLQTQDRFLEDLIGFQLSALTFCPWGFRRLDIDREALAGGALAITAAEGILPDGLPFEIPRSDAPPPPKPLEDYWQPDQKSMDLFLGIPEHRLGGRNVAASLTERSARYSSEIVARRDENTGASEKPIQVARKNFRLVAEGESQDGSTLLRVARVVRDASGGFQLDPAFVPPLVDVGASEALGTITHRLVEILSARSSALSGSRRQRGQGLADFGVTDVANFWLLYTVNTHLPMLRHIHETRQGHPSHLFSAMSALAGALTTFSTTVHPRDLPEYDHAELGACFARLDSLLRELLETVVPSRYAALPLRRTAPGVYATAIDQERHLSAPQIFLAVSAGVRQEELIQNVPRLAKLSSADRTDQLIRQALPGVPLRHVPSPPSALPLKLDYQYFAVETTAEEWGSVRRQRNLAVYLPADVPDPQMELLVVLPAER